jgi:hypothetical protein
MTTKETQIPKKYTFLEISAMYTQHLSTRLSFGGNCPFAATEKKAGHNNGDESKPRRRGLILKKYHNF